MNDATKTGVEKATGFDLVKALRDVSLHLAANDTEDDDSPPEYRELMAQLCMLLDLAAVTLERLGGERIRPFCAFCGLKSPEMGRTEADDAIRAHVLECPGHPMRAEIESLRAELARAREIIDERNPVSYCTHCLTRFPRGRAGIEAFRAHIPECSRHPLATAMRNKAFAVKVALRCLRERNESREELRKVRAERDALAAGLREVAREEPGRE